METTTVRKNGLVTLPASLRRKYGIRHGMKVSWLDTGTGLLMLIEKGRVVKLKGLWKGLKVDDKDVDAAKKSLFREEWPETRKMKGIVNSRLSARDLEEVRMEMR